MKRILRFRNKFIWLEWVHIPSNYFLPSVCTLHSWRWWDNFTLLFTLHSHKVPWRRRRRRRIRILCLI